jgi:hypothetical protein
MRKHNKRTLLVRLGYCYLTAKKECLVIVLTRQKHFSYWLVGRRKYEMSALR